MGAETCHLTVWTEHFLGTEAKCREFLQLLNSIDGGRWVPDKWGHYEPIRTPYHADSADSIVRAWTEERPAGTGRSRNSILFRKRAPSAALVDISTSRGQVPQLNWVSLDLAAKLFSGEDGPQRLMDIMLAIVGWGNAVHASASHSRQVHRRGVGGTPLLRLAQLTWLTFFGAPYVEMFGRSRLMSAPVHLAREHSVGIVLKATPRPDSPELTTSSELLVSLEEYLGPQAFAGRGYPDVPCKVPRFDLSETVISVPTTAPNRVH